MDFQSSIQPMGFQPIVFEFGRWFCLKAFTVKHFIDFYISSYHQLLKNKWYYVLYSTVKLISLCCKGERVGRRTSGIPDDYLLVTKLSKSNQIELKH
jgi:hypothetical protein